MENDAAGSSGAADDSRPDHTVQETEDRAVIEARLGVLAVRFGRTFSAEQRDAVRRTLGEHHQAAARLRRVPLTNADEPALLFVPHRETDQ